jgi:hypothetical protein
VGLAGRYVVRVFFLQCDLKLNILLVCVYYGLYTKCSKFIADIVPIQIIMLAEPNIENYFTHNMALRYNILIKKVNLSLA